MNVASLELCKELYEPDWRKIDGINYEANQYGEIRNVQRQKVISQYTNKEGYKSFTYYKDGRPRSFSVHVAVAKVFCPARNGAYQVNHKDSNPCNNRADNLEWVTSAENIEHSRVHGKANRYQNRGESHGMAKLTESDVRYIRQPSNESNHHLAARFNVSEKTIEDVKSGRRWKHVS